MKLFRKEFKRGMIIMWSGEVSNIPKGWHLCDGLATTPDLQDNFVVGAGVTYDPHDTGGAATHAHDISDHQHDHGIPAGVSIAAGEDFHNRTEDGLTSLGTIYGNSLPPFYALCFIMKV